MSGNVYPTPTMLLGTLLQDPTTAMQVATKEYVDAKVGGIPEAPTDGQTYGRDGQTAAWNPITLTPLASSTLPLMNGTASAGVATAWSRGDHVHPTDTSRYAASNPSSYVNAAGAAAAAPVQSVATRTGAIVLTHSDITDWASSLAPYALLASPTFTGTPSLPTGTTAITQTAGNSTTALATTAFVQAAVPAASSATPQMDGTAAAGSATSWSRADHIHPTDTSRAPLGSPTLTGTPTAPTATAGTSTTQIATTAFVQAAIPAVAPASTAPLMDGLAAVGTSLLYARQDHVHPTDTSRAPLASPGLTGVPTSPTPITTDNSTAIATTAFVKAQGYGTPPSPATVAPLIDGTAAVGTSLLYARQDHVHPTDTSRAPLASPALTGIPTVPTATAGTNTTQAASTAYVTSAITTGTSGYLPLTGGTVNGPLMVTATGASTSRSVQDQFGDIVDVKDFGAKGDGSTVDTAAFTAAAATGKTILVTPGTYIIGPITISQSMVGMGMGTTILQAAPGGSPTADALITQNAPVGATIRDLAINGANLCLYGIYLYYGTTQQTGLRFERLQVYNIGNTSSTASPLPIGLFVQLDDARPNSKQAIVIADCYVHDVYGNGISIGGIGCIVSHNTIVNTGSAGISCDILTDGIISDNTINSPGQVAAMAADGITGYGSQNLRVLVSNNTVENSGDNGIHMGGANIQIIGNKIYNVTVGHGIQLASSGAPTPGSNGLIANNEIDTVHLNGIVCNVFSRVIIVGNTLNNIGATSAGIAMSQSSDSIVADNIIWTGANGVYANGSVNLQVVNNRINGTSAQAIIDSGGASTGMRVSDNIVTSEGTTSNWDRVIAPLGSGQISLLPPGSGQVYSPSGLTVTQSASFPFQLVLVPGSPPLQELQFQGPNYGISCNGSTGNMNFLVGSPIMAVTSAGAAVTGTLGSSGALTVSAGGANITGATTLNGATSSTSGGLNFGAQVASSNTDFSKHILIYNSATGWGINYTTAALNVCATAGGSVNIACGSNNIATFNTSGVNTSVLVKTTGLSTAISTQTAAAYTVGSGDHSFILNPSATMTLTLPAVTGNNVGRILKFKLISAFAVNSATANVVPLAGGAATTAIMPATAGKYCMLQSDGANWQIMEAN